jgi:hypothetical protein
MPNPATPPPGGTEIAAPPPTNGPPVAAPPTVRALRGEQPAENPPPAKSE